MTGTTTDLSHQLLGDEDSGMHMVMSRNHKISSSSSSSSSNNTKNRKASEIEY